MAEQNPHPTGSEHGVYLSFEVQDSNWADQANCDPLADEFFVTRKGSADPLKLKSKYCDSCPVIADCLADDILNGVSQATIRGGVNHGERLKMLWSITKNRPYVAPKEMPSYRYRNAGFAGQMAAWRSGIVNEIQEKEPVVFAIEKQIEAGTVVPDAYYAERAAELEKLRAQLSFIDSEELR